MQAISSNSSKGSLTRRSFLHAAAVAVPYFVAGNVLGKDGTVAPSEKITLAIIGSGHRGRHDLRRALQMPDVQFVAICDVQKERRETAKNECEKSFGLKVNTFYRDFRDVLARQDIDTVLIATGDRWHAHASIYAAEAGKDVYSEKPCAITIDLCRKLAETMKRTNVIFQGGTQRRNLENFRCAAEIARTGKLGKLKAVHAAIYYLNNRYDWLPGQPEPDKEICDWDMWLGPAPWRPYNEEYIRGGWRGHDDFDSGAKHHDWGAHTVDLCQWAANADGSAPVKYWTEDVRLYAEYADGVKLIMRPNGWMGLGNCAVRFEGEDGWVETGDSGKIAVSSDALRQELTVNPAQYGGEKYGGGTHGEDPFPHIRNFFDCVKSREQPVCNADVICSSHIACHASALSWILKRKLTFDPKTDIFTDDEANRMKSRAMREPWTFGT
ncbi:MAG: Gfo/Idh/MocA family oxidoreductase [Planctomycetaceae bacterium]|jgi:predicted dehydrogenase|nr:Gfo/Idh/MocA family oxidoreductase [Planctomycetaceae bacterium]